MKITLKEINFKDFEVAEGTSAEEIREMYADGKLLMDNADTILYAMFDDKFVNIF